MLLTLLQTHGKSITGELYECDPTLLTTEKLCYFSATTSNTVGEDPLTDATPHAIEDVLENTVDGFRKIVDEAGTALSVTPKPWHEGDRLEASDTELTDYDLNYVKAFEMMAPLRDALMYFPETIAYDEGRWNELTQVFNDCHIKQDDTPGVDDPNHIAYSVDSIWGFITKFDGEDIHHSVLQFLEEGAIDLVCLMTDLVMDTRCPAIRLLNPADEGATMTECWKEAFDVMYPDDAGTTTEITDTTTTEIIDTTEITEPATTTEITEPTTTEITEPTTTTEITEPTTTEITEPTTTEITEPTTTTETTEPTNTKPSPPQRKPPSGGPKHRHHKRRHHRAPHF